MKLVLSTLLIFTLIGVIWFAQQSNLPRESQLEQPSSIPVITKQEILSASDFTQGIKQAVQNNNLTEVDKWFTKAIDLAEIANLSKDDLDYLRSELAQKVAVFQAKRSLFNDEVEQAYYKVEDIAPIKANYPEAQDLYAKVDGVIKQRNQLIMKIAEEIAQGQPVSDQTLEAARQQWQSRFASKIKVKE